MRKILFLTMLMLCLISSCLAASFPGWSKTSIPNFLAFEVPPTLEVSNAYLQQLNENLQTYKPGDKKVFHVQLVPNQSSGLPTNSAKVDIRVVTGRRENSAFGQPLNISAEQLKQWQDSYMQKVQKIGNIKINITNPAELYSVDNIPCTYLEYCDQLEGLPMFYNYIYRFFDKDKVYFIAVHIQHELYNEWIKQGVDIRNIVRTLQPL